MDKDFRITLLPGDGVGASLVDGAIAVLNAIERKFGHDFHMTVKPFGGSAIDLSGVQLPAETVEACKQSDGILIGAVGGKRWQSLPPHARPEKALHALYSALGLYAGLYHTSTGGKCSPLKPAVSRRGIDIMLVKDLLGGLNSGEQGYRDGVLGQEAYDTDVYAISEIERIAKVAFELATTRGKTVTDVTKSDTMSTSRLWRATVDRVAKSYPAVSLKHENVANFITSVTLAPNAYDVVLASDATGDIVAGALSGIVGSAGLLPACAIGGANTVGVYGNAQRLAENPVGIILSAAWLLSSLGLQTESDAIENAVNKVLAKGLRTVDVADGKKYVNCELMSEEIVFAIINS